MTKELPVDPDVRILKTGTCPTLNGKSKLTYQVGAKSESEIAMRVTACSGGGFFSPEWVPLTSIARVVLGASKAGLTSASLRGVFNGKSVNTAGFLLAVLRHEGAVQLQPEKSRLHEPADFDAFVKGLRALIQTGADKASPLKGKAATAPKKAIQKASAKRV